jgi:hypothetical protein
VHAIEGAITGLTTTTASEVVTSVERRRRLKLGSPTTAGPAVDSSIPEASPGISLLGHRLESPDSSVIESTNESSSPNVNIEGPEHGLSVA